MACPGLVTVGLVVSTTALTWVCPLWEASRTAAVVASTSMERPVRALTTLILRVSWSKR